MIRKRDQTMKTKATILAATVLIAVLLSECVKTAAPARSALAESPEDSAATPAPEAPGIATDPPSQAEPAAVPEQPPAPDKQDTPSASAPAIAASPAQRPPAERPKRPRLPPTK
jgi:hypothetical protein